MKQREIKIRAWDKENNKWEHNFLLDSAGNPFKNNLGKLEPLLRGSLVFVQYTGLKDKNGKEIYEGDIVKGVVKFVQLLIGDTDENCNFKMAGSVFYDHSGFSIKCIQSMCDEEREGLVNYFDFIGKEGEIFDDKEVIGNVWQNSELLK